MDRGLAATASRWTWTAQSNGPDVAALNRARRPAPAPGRSFGLAHEARALAPFSSPMARLVLEHWQTTEAREGVAPFFIPNGGGHGPRVARLGPF